MADVWGERYWCHFERLLLEDAVMARRSKKEISVVPDWELAADGLNDDCNPRQGDHVITYRRNKRTNDQVVSLRLKIRKPEILEVKLKVTILNPVGSTTKVFGTGRTDRPQYIFRYEPGQTIKFHYASATVGSANCYEVFPNARSRLLPNWDVSKGYPSELKILGFLGIRGNRRVVEGTSHLGHSLRKDQLWNLNPLQHPRLALIDNGDDIKPSHLVQRNHPLVNPRTPWW